MVKLIKRRVGYNGCDNCWYKDNKVDPSYFTQYNLWGFCTKYVAWITLLDDKEMPIQICEK